MSVLCTLRVEQVNGGGFALYDTNADELVGVSATKGGIGKKAHDYIREYEPKPKPANPADRPGSPLTVLNGG